LDELETRRERQGLGGFRLIQPPKSKTLRSVWWNYAWKGSPLEWSSRPPYMADGLGFPFEVGGPSSGSITN
jgi:hypothetical protein